MKGRGENDNEGKGSIQWMPFGRPLNAYYTALPCNRAGMYRVCIEYGL